MVNTPVLFETFVRVDYARQVWDAIKVAQPKKLYFYSNKGRTNKEGEIERNDEIRSWINEIDWECELHTWFRDECVDVYTSLRGAISWLFENEESGIILEDDIVPTNAFFSFADQMIEKFRDEKKVWYVSGDNFHNLNPSGYDYIFSRYHWMYGWATWRDRWNQIKWGDFDLAKISSMEYCKNLYKTKDQTISRYRQILYFKDMALKTNCWDLALGYTVDAHLGVGVFPKNHLVHNIGLSGQHHGTPKATFVNVEPTITSPTYIIEFCPRDIDCDCEYDYLCYRVRRKFLSFRSRISSFFRMCFHL